jgi:hypothetical protein
LRYCKTFNVSPKEAEKTLTYADIFEFLAFEKMESKAEFPMSLHEHYLDQIRQLTYICAQLQMTKGKVNDYVNTAGYPHARLTIKDYKPPTLEEIKAAERKKQEMVLIAFRARKKGEENRKKKQNSRK